MKNKRKKIILKIKIKTVLIKYINEKLNIIHYM